MPPQTYHSLEPAVPAPPGHPGPHTLPHEQTVYYMYRDANGRPHIVDSVGLLPPGARHVQRMQLGEPPQEPAVLNSGDLAPRPEAVLKVMRDVLPSWIPTGQPASPSVGTDTPAAPVGLTQHLLLWMPMGGLLVAMLLLALLMRPLRTLLFRGALAMVGLSLVGSAYMALVGRRGGVQGAAPAGVIQAAEQSVRQMQNSMNQEKLILDRINQQAP